MATTQQNSGDLMGMDGKDVDKHATPLTPSNTNPDLASKLAKSSLSKPTPPGRSSTMPPEIAGPGSKSPSHSQKSRFSAATHDGPHGAIGSGSPLSGSLGGSAGGQGKGSMTSGMAAAKSMPGSRRTSTIIPTIGGGAGGTGTGGSASAGVDGSFGLDKLKLGEDVEGEKDEDFAAENAQNSVKFLQLNSDDDGFLSKSKKISTASAALDLAPLSQTATQRFGTHSRPFDTGLKTSEWPQFSGIPKNASDGIAGSVTAPSSLDRERARGASLNVNVGGATHGGSSNGSNGPSTPAPQLSPNISRRGSPSGLSAPSGLADSIASLPAMPTRSVPGTPAGPGGLGQNKLGFSSLRASSGVGAGGIAGGSALEGLTPAQRGYSNPDLAKAFSKSSAGSGFAPLGVSGPRAYGNADPLYSNMNLGGHAGGMPGGSLGGHHFQSGYGDGYVFDDEFGPGALYSGGGGGGGGMKHKRADMDRDYNRFAGQRIEDLQPQILSMCKDQHGCRYLQKKLEEEVPEHRDLIFRETYGHFPELMTDSFGNYLCQKLLEYSTDEQRTAICDSVANDLVAISLNMHGTRAVQKMIDFLSNTRQPTQIRSIIVALSLNVVPLIKDLNGNHVIQKCLNKLAAEDNQFIYNAVAAHCVEVATHRHGCCVLQRCIDHAADNQRVQLVTEITYHALTLVQDPFGNYVVQYVLDLNDVRFSEALIRQFIGNVCALSVQKFSSNVIEKCIRVADPDLRKILIGELANGQRLEKLLRDSFANYVVQTALDYADPAQRVALVENIRPILPQIRNIPYGKRIQSKLQREQMGGFHDTHSSYGGSSGGGHHGQNQFMNLGSMNNGYGGGGHSGRGGGGSGYGGHQGHRSGYGGSHNHMGGGMNHNMHHHNPMNGMYGQQGQMGGYGGGFNGGMGGAGFDLGFAGQMNGLGAPQQYGGIGQQQSGHVQHQQPFGGQGAYGGVGAADAAVQFPPGAFSVGQPGQAGDSNAVPMGGNSQQQGYQAYL